MQRIQARWMALLQSVDPSVALLLTLAPLPPSRLQALGDSLDERPTHAQAAEQHEALQQQLGGLSAELDAVKARLRGAGQDIQHLKDWQVGLVRTQLLGCCAQLAGCQCSCCWVSRRRPGRPLPVHPAELIFCIDVPV